MSSSSSLVAIDSVRRLNQNAILDQIADGRLDPDTAHGTPASLRPDRRISEGAAMGSRVAKEIAKAWRFSEPIRTMSSAELADLSARCHVDFLGRSSDLNHQQVQNSAAAENSDEGR